MAGRVTYSRNVTLSLSRSCACHCKYCAFSTHRNHLQQPEEVERILNRASRSGIKELLILTGERPDSIPGVSEALAELGHSEFTDYVVWTCERALERGILPHTNLGPVTDGELARLRPVTASQGLMLESMAERLLDTVHAASPGKDPKVRLETLRAAGRLKIPFTSGILVGIGETAGERLETLDALAAIHAEYGHIQEVIIQNFVPHRRYYGEEPAEIAEEAAEAYWRSGVGRHPSLELPEWACEVSVEDLVDLVRAARERMPDVAIQVPPNLSDWWIELVDAGADDLGGLSANGDHISPEHPFPSPRQVGARLAERGIALTERLCVHNGYIAEEWVDPRVMEVIRAGYASFMPRRTRDLAAAGTAIPRDRFAGLLTRAHAGAPLDHEDVEALFAETRPGPVEDMRQAADSLREELAGDTVTFVVNRNINISNVCIVGCAFCGFGKGPRSPEAFEHGKEDFVRRVGEAVAFGATELCIQSGIHPDWRLADYSGWLELARSVAPEIHLHAYSPMEIDHICKQEGMPAAEVFGQLIDSGLGSVPGTAAEILDDAVRGRISPNKLPADRWVELIEAAHSLGLPTTSTVMYGHIETPSALAVHMLAIRGLHERTSGITEFVPLTFVPDQTRLGRSHGILPLALDDSLRHTAAFRLSLGRSVPNLQASWVKIGMDGATESLDWGANDLGGTLMEESITRMAGGAHGTRREPADLIAAAHSAGRPAAQRSTLYSLVTAHPLRDEGDWSAWARHSALAG